MSKPFNLQPLLDLMQSRSDEKTRRLGQLIAAEHSARSRLHLLEQYRQEYAQRLQETAAQGLTPMSLRNFQEFIQRIDAAIAQQRQMVTASEHNTAVGQSEWREQNQRLKAIDTLSQRHDQRERYREHRLDQKQQDEFASRPRPRPGDPDSE